MPRDKPKFRTREGLDVPAVTREQMKEIDRISVEETGPGLLQMMEHAGRSLAELVLALLEVDASEARVVVLAGTGGNGGGGICAARHLSLRVGDVVLCVSDRERLSEAARVQLDTFRHAEGQIIAPGRLDRVRPDLVVDAVLGYGLEGAPRRVARELIEWSGSSGAPVVSLDIPSGVDSDTGAAPGVFTRPVATLTLALPKIGLAHAETGDLWLADLGIPVDVYRRVGIDDQAPFGTRFRLPLVRG